MAKRGNGSKGFSGSAANLGFKAKLWLAVGKLRNNMDAAEYKHVVLGLIFLKYISDSFEEHRARRVRLGKGLFKSWFVDFDPVWAKMDGRQPAGMDAAAAALSPDRSPANRRQCTAGRHTHGSTRRIAAETA